MKLLPMVLLAAACARPAAERAQDELTVGVGEFVDVTVEVTDRLAAIRELSDHELDLWCSAPDIEVVITVGDAGVWRVIAQNSMTDAVLVVDGGAPRSRITNGDAPTVATFEVELEPGTHRLRIAPPDADVIEPYRVAAMADIQKALPSVDDVFDLISTAQPRFVVGMGDITQRAEPEEYEMFDRQLAYLTVPFYTTLGNHELWSDHMRFFERYGRASFQFTFKGVAYTFADSGDAGLDPIVEGWVDAWLDQAREKLSIFLTHIPPIDPVGIRNGSFRSAADGHRLISTMVNHDVDLALYGHIHTLSQFDHAGIPAFISGGGGADPMAWDGIDRHFLVIELDPDRDAASEVEVYRVPDRE